MEQMPLLYVDWSGGEGAAPPAHTPPLIELSSGAGIIWLRIRARHRPNDEYWNRDMFRLIGSLTRRSQWTSRVPASGDSAAAFG